MSADHLWACLMYHEIPAESGSVSYFAVPRPRFAHQLSRITALGMLGTSLELRLQTSGAKGRLVAITFDDGHRTHFAHAYHELLSHGMAATFFVITDRVGQDRYVTWPQLTEMAAAGMSIQSHTATHPLLSGLSDAEVRRELRESKQRLDDELRQDTQTLALPGGDAPRGDARHGWSAVRQAGYRFVATSAWGPNYGDAPFTIRRYTVRRDTSARRLDACIRAESAATSPEGLRLAALTGLRRAVGAQRYAGWRRRLFEALGRG